MERSSPNRSPRRSFWAAFMIGVGLMAGVDEILFHQILAWHHFYDGDTLLVGLMTDGLLHAAELILIVAGFLLFSDTRRRGALIPKWSWAGFFLGAGAFQVFDGIIDHKILRIHQIRYGVDNLLVYDLVWNIVGAMFMAIGVVILLRALRDQQLRRDD